MDNSIELPDVIADNVIRVDDEAHEYEVYSDGTKKDEYALEKAGGDAIEHIKEVTGSFNGRTHTFVKGTDYELSTDNERIVWLSGDRPDANTQFYVTYRTESIISRYTQSGEEELDAVEEAIIESINSKFIDQADDEDLDEIGKLFGELGKRRGRDKADYKVYLKSVVQSFISRGTVSGITTAVAAALGVETNLIEIRENFEDTSYEIYLPPFAPHRTSTIASIADIADPSGVERTSIRYPLSDEDVGVTDSVRTSLGKEAAIEELTISDEPFVNKNNPTVNDELALADSVSITIDIIRDLVWEPNEIEPSEWDKSRWVNYKNLLWGDTATWGEASWHLE